MRLTRPVFGVLNVFGCQAYNVRIKRMKKFLSILSFLGLACLTPLSQPVAHAADKNPKLKAYPLDTCSVSGEKLGEMGKPYVMEYKGREIKFCCKSCVKDFNKDPEKFVKKLEQAEAKAKK
jgi:YHS domain-containing protein